MWFHLINPKTDFTVIDKKNNKNFTVKIHFKDNALVIENRLDKNTFDLFRLLKFTIKGTSGFATSTTGVFRYGSVKI